MDLDSATGNDCTPFGTRIVNTHTRIQVTGALDRPGVGALHDDVVALLTLTRPAEIIIDTHQVTAVDSRALGVLVQCQRAAAAAGSALAIVNPSPLLWQVLWTAGLLGVFGLLPALTR